jgi:hypothetical protein
VDASHRVRQALDLQDDVLVPIVGQSEFRVLLFNFLIFYFERQFISGSKRGLDHIVVPGDPEAVFLTLPQMLPDYWYCASCTSDYRHGGHATAASEHHKDACRGHDGFQNGPFPMERQWQTDND